MAISVERRRDPLTYVGIAMLIAGLLAAAVVVAHIILVQGGWGLDSTGFLHSLRRAGWVLTAPFHGLVDINRWKSEELVNDAIAAAVFFFAGLLMWRLLR